MAPSRRIQKLARERQRATGERYTTALAHVRTQRTEEAMETTETTTETTAPRTFPTRLEYLAQRQRAEHARQWDDAARDELIKRVVSRIDRDLIPVLVALPKDAAHRMVLQDETGDPICVLSLDKHHQSGEITFGKLLDGQDPPVSIPAGTVAHQITFREHAQEGHTDSPVVVDGAWLRKHADLNLLQALDAFLDDLLDTGDVDAPTVYERCLAMGALTTDQFVALPAVTVPPGEERELQVQAVHCLWAKRLVLDSDHAPALVVTSVVMGTTPVNVGENGTPLTIFLREADPFGIAFGRRLVLSTQPISVTVRNVSSSPHVASGIVSVDLLNPYLAQMVWENIIVAGIHGSVDPETQIGAALGEIIDGRHVTGVDGRRRPR